MAAHDAEVASRLTGDDNLARSAVRLRRSTDCLDQSSRRVGRRPDRRRDPRQ